MRCTLVTHVVDGQAAVICRCMVHRLPLAAMTPPSFICACVIHLACAAIWSRISRLALVGDNLALSVLVVRRCGQSRVMHEVANHFSFHLSQTTEYEQAGQDAHLAESATTDLGCIVAVDLTPPSRVACPAAIKVRRTRGQDEGPESGVDRRRGPVASQDQSLDRQQGSAYHRKHNLGAPSATRSCRGKSGNASKTSVGASYVFER